MRKCGSTEVSCEYVVCISKGGASDVLRFQLAEACICFCVRERRCKGHALGVQDGSLSVLDLLQKAAPAATTSLVTDFCVPLQPSYAKPDVKSYSDRLGLDEAADVHTAELTAVRQLLEEAGS